MGALGIKLRTIAGGRIGFWCPGCDGAHVVRVEGDDHPRWTFNGEPERATLSPSILVTYDGRDAGVDDAPPARCHSFVREGRIEFLSDCTHALAGRTVELPPFPADFNTGD